MSGPSSPTDYWAVALHTLDPSLQLIVSSTIGGRVNVLAGVLRVAKDQREECLKKRWRFRNFNGDTVIIRDILERIVKWIERFKAIGDVAVGADQVHASLPWAAIRFLLECATSDINVFGSVVENLEVIASLVVVYREFERLHLRRSSSVRPQIEQALVRLYSVILEELGHAVKFFNESSVTRIAKSLFRVADGQLVEVKKKEAELLKLAGLVDTDVLLNLETMTIRLVDNARYSVELVEKTRYQEIMRWLSQSDFRCHHEDVSSCRLPNTCQWLSNHTKYRTWLNSSCSSILMLYGVPGSGKSVLASSVIESLMSARNTHPDLTPFAYFYCCRSLSEAGRSQPDNIMRCILKQLALSPDSQCKVKETLLSEYDRRRARAELDGLEESQARKLGVHDCIRLILDISRSDAITIVVDAVDELEESSRAELLQALLNIIDNSENIAKVFLTSRNDDMTLKMLENQQRIRVHQNDNAEDLECYVTHRIKEAVDHKLLLGGSVSPQLFARLRLFLLDRAGEMFIWVKLQLEQFYRIKHEQDLTRAMDEDRPVTLDHLYTDLLHAILNAERGARELAIGVFSWLLYANEPLHPKALISAITRTNTHLATSITLEDAQRACYNLIVEDTDAVRFVHRSAKDFVRALPAFSPMSGNKLLAEACLHKCMEGPPDPAISPQKIEFYRYAAMYWGDHVRLSHPLTEKDNLFDPLCDFLLEEKGGGEPSFCFMAWSDYVRGILPSISWEHPKYVQLDAVANSHDSPLFAACIFGLVQFVEYLSTCSTISDWNQLNGRGYTAIYLACRQGYTEIARILIDRGANIEIECGTLGNALNAACFSRNKSIIELLLTQKTTKWNPKTYRGALERAFYNFSEEISIMLIADGKSVYNQEDYDQLLLNATEAGLIKVVDELLKSSPSKSLLSQASQSYNKAIRAGRTPMIHYMMRKLSHSFMDLPKDSVATAALHGHIEIVTFLLGIGMDVEEDGQYGSPLRVACLMDHRDVALALIRNGADVNAHGSLGTALEAASMRGCTDMVRLLLDEGAHVSVGSGSYETPINAAISNGHIDVTKLLISAGATTYALPTEVIALASRGGHEKMLSFLKEQGIRANYPGPMCQMGPDRSRSLLRDNSPSRLEKSPGSYSSRHKGCTHDSFSTSALSRSDVSRFLAVYLEQNGSRNSQRKAYHPRAFDIMNRSSPVVQLSHIKTQASWDYDSGPADALIEAAGRGEIHAVENLLAERKNDTEDLIRSFHHAISQKHFQIAELIQGKSVSDADQWQVALFTSGYLPFVEQGIGMLSSNASENRSSRDIRPLDTYSTSFRRDTQITAFLRACEIGNMAVVDLLKKATPDLYESEVLVNALEICAEAGFTDMTASFLESVGQGLALEAFEHILMCAAYHNRVETLTLVLTRVNHLGEMHSALSKPLVAAITMGQSESVDILIKNGVNVNTRVPDRLSQIHSSDRLTFRPPGQARNRDNERESWRESASPLDACMKQLKSSSSLDKAIEYKKILRALLHAGANVNEFPGPFPTPFLHRALSFRSADVAHLLVEYGADLSASRVTWSQLPGIPFEIRTELTELRLPDVLCLEEDAASFVEDMVQRDETLVHSYFQRALSFFVEHGQSMDKPYFPCSNPVFNRPKSLGLVFSAGLGAVVRNLLIRQPDQKATSKHYAVLLQMAAFLDLRGYIKLLIEREVDVNAVVDYYGTALQAASRRGHVEVVNMLLQAGSDVNIVAGEHKTALRAAIIGAHEKVVQILISNGATDLTDEDMRKALTEVYRNRSGSIASLLLQVKPSFDISQPYLRYAGPTLLHYACRIGRDDLVRTFLDHGADIDSTAEDACSPITVAASQGHIRCIKVLIQYGAVLSAEPILESCAHRRPNVLDFLLDQMEKSRAGIPPSLLQKCIDRLSSSREEAARDRHGLRSGTPVRAQLGDEGILEILAEYGVGQGASGTLPLPSAAWTSQTPKNLVEFESQSTLALNKFTNPRSSSPIAPTDAFKSLVKGQQLMAHQFELMKAQINELEAANTIHKERKSRKRKRLQTGGILNAAQAEELQAGTENGGGKKGSGLSSSRQAPTRHRCTKCRGTGHNARTCQKAKEEVSESDALTEYVFPSSEAAQSDPE